jgi:DNA-binding beta-propeller fold protein YncE
MIARARSRNPPSGAPALVAVVAACALGASAMLGAALAAADACPGAGGGACPYSAVRMIGQRAEGMLRFPEAVALDAQGNVYVADQLSFVVQKFNAAGAFVTEWGSYGGGTGQFGPIGGLATDAAGDVYVVDSSHNRIEKFDSSGNFITTWGHTGGEPGQFRFYSSLDPTKPPGGGIAVGGSYVYVADSGNNRIQRFTLAGTEPLAWGTKGSAPGDFSYPRAVAANESEVIVADDDNHRVEKFAPEGAFQSEAGSEGSGPGQFSFPYGVSLDAAGNVYVADDTGHRIVKLSPALGYLAAWGGFGSSSGQLAFPRALAADALGDTYVADTANDRVQEFDPAGNYVRTLGVSARSPGAVTAPSGVATDPSGGVFVSDTVGNRIERYAAGGEAFAGVWTSAGAGGLGFSSPAGIAVDPRGAVYVADARNARVVHMWGDGTFLSELGAGFGSTELQGVHAVAADPATGWTYLADTAHNRVLAFGPEGALRARVGADGGDGAAGSSPGEFKGPSAVAVVPGRAVYVADRENNRVVRLSPTGAFETAWGSPGSGTGELNAPSGVATDAAGRVAVLDGGNNRVQIFDANGRYLARWGVRGAGAGELSQPQAIAIDCAGRVYVADTNNNRVQRFDVTLTAAPGCEAPGAWPPPLDVAPVVQVKLLRRAGVLARRGLALSVSCERGCKLLASATLRVRGTRARVALAPYARTLQPALAGHVRLRLGPRGLHRMRRLLGRRAVFTARVVVIAAGPTGRRTTVTRTYTVRR